MSTLQSLLEELTSSSLDTATSFRRRCLVEELEGYLFPQGEDNEETSQIQQLVEEESLLLTIGTSKNNPKHESFSMTQNLLSHVF